MAYGSSTLRVFLAAAERRGDVSTVTKLKRQLAKAEERDCLRAAELGRVQAAQEAFDHRFGIAR